MDWVSWIRDQGKTNPGSRGQKRTGSRIRNTASKTKSQSDFWIGVRMSWRLYRAWKRFPWAGLEYDEGQQRALQWVGGQCRAHSEAVHGQTGTGPNNKEMLLYKKLFKVIKIFLFSILYVLFLEQLWIHYRYILRMTTPIIPGQDSNLGLPCSRGRRANNLRCFRHTTHFGSCCFKIKSQN